MDAARRLRIEDTEPGSFEELVAFFTRPRRPFPPPSVLVHVVTEKSRHVTRRPWDGFVRTDPTPPTQRFNVRSR